MHPGAPDVTTVVDALIKQAHKLSRELYKSLTWDRGKEIANHQRYSLATDVRVYSCDTQQPWQHGSNENTNGLLRQYFPKGMNLSDIPQSKLSAIARRLNERPRRTLGFETPAECFGQWLRRSVESATLKRHSRPAALRNLDQGAKSVSPTLLGSARWQQLGACKH